MVLEIEELTSLYNIVMIVHQIDVSWRDVCKQVSVLISELLHKQKP